MLLIEHWFQYEGQTTVFESWLLFKPFYLNVQLNLNSYAFFMARADALNIYDFTKLVQGIIKLHEDLHFHERLH